MSGDYSRHTFDPKRDFSGVLMQQGRVQLDADWNELVEILDRRWRAETTDIIGRCVVPKETPDGFKIQIAGGTLIIGRGRMYVHGLLAENHGKKPLAFDPVLAEERGTLPVPYAEQPYLLSPPSLPGGGPHLVYLDVWQRELTYLEKPELIERAVGVDTTARLQTVWQVKLLANVGATVTCATPDNQIPGWLDLAQPSAGRLTTGTTPVQIDPDPCLIPPTGGYKGLENQLYRVEIHNGGPLGTATFKWSRDNATVAASVTAIPTLDQLIVTSTGRDSVLRFTAGNWVEITDDERELAGLPGEMSKIKSVDDPTRTITIESSLPAVAFPTDAQGKINPTRHTRVRRWDQKGKVLDSNGNQIFDLDGGGSAGVIPVPAAGTSVILEHGVTVAFHTNPAGGKFRVGDYWVFAARTADASVELLDKALPLGIHHHYCRLALVTFPGSATDCRVLWPPEVSGKGCDCSVCVTAESHNSGALTIQWAIDQVKQTGGKVCLGSGVYHLGQTSVQITGAGSVRLTGHGWKTMLLYSGAGPAIAINDSSGVVVEELSLFYAAQAGVGDRTIGGGPGVELRNCLGATIQRCIIAQIGSQERGAAAIGLEGYLFGTIIRENALGASIGIGNLVPRGEGAGARYLLTAGLYVQDNTLFCERRGISLGGFSLHTGETRLSGNVINGGLDGGIVVVGRVFLDSPMNVHGNELFASGNGIVIGTDGARVTGNDISAITAGKGGDGIVLAPGLDPSGMDRCQVFANRVTGVAGHGIAIRARVRSAMIKQNVIEAVGGSGIVMEEKSQADGLSIENNQLLDIAPQASKSGTSVVGIRLINTRQAEVASNTITGVGRAAVDSASRAGIQVIASSSVRIAGNEVVDIGPSEFVKESAGIEVLPPFDRVDVVDNVVRRSQQPPQTPDTSNWYALRVRGGVAQVIAVDNSILTAAFSRRAAVAPQPPAVGDAIWVFLGASLRVLPRGREIVAVRGNLLEAHGDVPTVEIGSAGACVFSDNRALLASRARPVVTSLVAGALIASGNYLRGPKDTHAMDVQVGQGPFTVLGNIASGPIQVNGAALSGPWAPLNAIALQ